jgi:MFS family permease
MDAETTYSEIAERPTLEMSDRRRWAVVAGVMTGMAIAALEATVVGTAMPTVIASLGGINHYSWVFSAYLVTSTVTVPVWGKLSDLYGRRLTYQAGIGVFLLGTLLSGLAGSMAQLIIFRAIQGLGAGALIPLGMTIIGDTFTLKERAKMQAYFSGVWGLSSVVGPIIGGFITDQISWRWVFFVNLPIGVLAALIIGFALKEPKNTQKPTVDYAGAALLMLAISLLMLAMVEGGTSMASLLSAENIAIFVAGVVLLGVFGWVENRAPDPIIPFHLFKNRTVAGGGRGRFPRGHRDVRRYFIRTALCPGVIGHDRDQGGVLAYAANVELGDDVCYRGPHNVKDRLPHYYYRRILRSGGRICHARHVQPGNAAVSPLHRSCSDRRRPWTDDADAAHRSSTGL